MERLKNLISSLFQRVKSLAKAAPAAVAKASKLAAIVTVAGLVSWNLMIPIVNKIESLNQGPLQKKTYALFMLAMTSDGLVVIAPPKLVTNVNRKDGMLCYTDAMSTQHVCTTYGLVALHEYLKK